MTRFYEGPEWRFVVTDLAAVTTTFLDRLASGRTVTRVLNMAAVAAGSVPGDSPEITILHTDGDPFLEEGNRLLYGFRREGGSPPWVCRFAGLVMQLEDTVDGDVPRSNYTAFDPWQYLYSRPVVIDTSGTLPPSTGYAFSATAGNVIAATLLGNSIASTSTGPTASRKCFIDAGVAYGGTSYWAGTIETTGNLDITFQQGLSIGEAWTQLAQTGSLDIVLTPVYDPVNRPGILADLSIRVQAGAEKPGAIFAWDMPPRNLVAISRLKDGATRANKIQFYEDQGGSAVALASDATSVTKYGQYWAQQFFPGQPAAAAVTALAQMELLLRKNGRTTVTISPAAERAPVPWTEYDLGDRVPVYASKRLRKQLSGYQRVYGIPLQISDDALEHIDALLVSPDGFS